jgi:hypothetical protein
MLSNLKQSGNGTPEGSFETLQDLVDWYIEKVDSSYTSPGNSAEARRRLQADSTAIQNAIMCIQPNDAASFEVSSEHFPVYLKDSVLNSNPNFDFGEFESLKTKLVNSGMDISSFFFTFTAEGNYLFGDYSNQDTQQTLFHVSNDCSDSKNIYPLTLENLQELGITPEYNPVSELSDLLVLIPIFFILLSIGITAGINYMETYIKKKEQEEFERKHGKLAQFTNKEGEFDKKKYLADIYKMIKAHLDEIKRVLAEGGSREDLYKLLKEKASLLGELEGQDQSDVVDSLKEQFNSLLSNMRFPDGRSLKELLQEKEM